MKNVQLLKNLKRTLRGLFVVLILSGCQTIPVYNKEVCVDGGELGAACYETYANKERELDKDAWAKQRAGWFCTDSTGFNDTEVVIEQFCFSYPGVCDYRTRERMKSTLKKMNDRSAKAKKETGR